MNKTNDLKSFRTGFVTLLYIYLSLSAKEKFNIIGSKANQIQLFNGAYWQTSDRDYKRNLIFFSCNDHYFFISRLENIFKNWSKDWNSLTSGTAINNLNPTTLPNQNYNEQAELPLLLQPLNCAHSLTAAPPIPTVIALISPSALEFCKFELFTSIYFTGIIFLNYFLKVTDSQHSMFICSSEWFLREPTGSLTAKTHYVVNTAFTLQISCKHICIKPQQALDQEIQHLQWFDFTSLLFYKNIKNHQNVTIKNERKWHNKQRVKPCHPGRYVKLASENISNYFSGWRVQKTKYATSVRENRIL